MNHDLLGYVIKTTFVCSLWANFSILMIILNIKDIEKFGLTKYNRKRLIFNGYVLVFTTGYPLILFIYTWIKR